MIQRYMHSVFLCQLLESLRVVSEARVSKLHTRARCVCALSIQRLEGSRLGLRRTRTLWKLNWWKSGCGDAPGTCGWARLCEEREEELLNTQSCCEQMSSQSC